MLTSKRRMFFKKGVALFAAVCMLFSVPVDFTVLAKEDSLDNEEGLLHTNLEELKIGEGSGSWEITEEGLHGSGTGDNFILSESQGTDFIYEADVTFKEARGAAS